MLLSQSSPYYDLHHSTNPHKPSSSPFNSHNFFPQFPSKIKSLKHYHCKNPQIGPNIYSGSRFFLGLKIHCISTGVLPQPRTIIHVNDRKRSKNGGGLESIVRSLEPYDDIAKLISLYGGKMGPRELSVILKDQGKKWERVLRVFDWVRRQDDYVGNVIHYNIVLRSLGRARRWDKLRFYWVEMRKDGVAPTNNTYSMLVDVCGKAGMVGEAVCWVRHMRCRGMFPDEVTMSTVVGVLKNAREFDAADRFYKGWCVGKVDFEDFDLDVAVLRSWPEAASLRTFILDEIVKIDIGKQISKVAVESERKGSFRRPQLTATYNTLIDLYGKADRLSDAANVFSEMLRSGVAPDVVTFNTMIHTCGSHGHLPEAEALFYKMEERGVRPDTKTYNIFLSLYAEAGTVDAAVRCFRKIREVGLFPEVETYRAVLYFLCKRQMVQEAEDVIREMNKFRVPIDEHSLPVIVEMYVNEGLLDHAAEVLQKSKLGRRISSKTYAAVINTYAVKGLWAEAESVFFRRNDFAKVKDVSEYNVMIKAYGEARLYVKAFSLFKEMKNSGTCPDVCTYNSLVQMFSGADLVDRGRELLAEMQGLGFIPKCSTFSCLIASYVRLGQVSDAVDVFQDMERAAVEPNEVVYGSLINGFAEADRIDDALYYYKLMEDRGLSANQIILTSLVKAYSKRRDLNGAKRMYERIMELKGEPDKIALNSMLNLYARLGIAQDAEVIFNTMKGKGWVDRCTYASMIYLYKTVGMFDDAVSVANEMKQSLCLPSEGWKESASLDQFALNSVVDLYADVGKVSDAELIFDAMKDKNWANGFTYASMMRLYKRVGMLDKAAAVVNQMRQSLCSQSESVIDLGGNLNKFDLNSMIDLFADLRMVPDAKMVFDRMKQKALADGFTYGSMMRLYKHARMLDEAVQIAEEMNQFFGISSGRFSESDNGLDKFALNGMISLYAGLRMVSDAEAIFEAMKGKGWADGFTFASMMLLYKNLGMLEEAVSIAEEMKQFLSSNSESLEELEGGLDHFALKSMINLYTDLGRISDARVRFDTMKVKGWADIFRHASMMRMYKGAGMFDEAVDIAQEIKQSFCMASDGLKELRGGLHIFALKSMLNLYSDLRMVSDAIMIFDTMKVKGWADGFTYSSMIRLYKQAGMLPEALAIVEEMKQSLCGTSEKSKELGGGLNKFALNSMIDIYADLGMSADANLIFHKMKEHGWVNKFTYASMMRLYRSMGMLDVAVAIADALRQSGLLMDSALYAKVMALYATKGKLEECGLLLREMLNRKIMPGSRTFKALLTVLKKLRLAKEAVDQLEASYQQEKPCAQQAIITCVFSALGWHALAVEYCIALTEMEMGLDSCAYNVAIYVFGSAGKSDKALNCYKRMLGKGMQPDLFTYTSLVRCYGEANMVEDVKRVHNQLRYGEIEPSASLFAEVVDVYAKAKRRNLVRLAKQDRKLVLDEHRNFNSEIQGESKHDTKDISHAGQPSSDYKDEGQGEWEEEGERIYPELKQVEAYSI